MSAWKLWLRSCRQVRVARLRSENTQDSRAVCVHHPVACISVPLLWRVGARRIAAGGWLTSIAGAGVYRMIVFEALAMCDCRTKPPMFDIAAAPWSCMRVAPSGWSWSCLACRATRSQVSAKGLRNSDKFSKTEVSDSCIGGEKNSVTPADMLW